MKSGPGAAGALPEEALSEEQLSEEQLSEEELSEAALLSEEESSLAVRIRNRESVRPSVYL